MGTRKGGVNVCQQQLVNEVLEPLVTEFVPNFGREGATPIQRGSNASLLHRVRPSKSSDILLADISAPPPTASVACCAHQVQNFDLSQRFWCRGLWGHWPQRAKFWRR
jgi:hypothetical protein